MSTRGSPIKYAAFKVMKYGFYDLLRSRWIFVYLLFFGLITAGLLYVGQDASQAVLSVLNLVLLVVPLICLVVGLTYYYYTRNFLELMLAQPVSRLAVFCGHYAGLALPLIAAFVLGCGAPFLFFSSRAENAWGSIFMLLLAGVLISIIFSALAFWIGLRTEERMRALGTAIGLWLAFTILYDALLLIFIMLAQRYPLERPLIGLSLLNPIDLSRTLVMLRLDSAALMGYTGAVFEQFFGSTLGVIITLGTLLLWAIVPIIMGAAAFLRKNF